MKTIAMGKKKVATIVIASAIGVSAMATSAFAYTDNIRDLIYLGVGKIVTQLTPSINTALDQNQNAINAQIEQDAISARDYALQVLQAYRDTLIQQGVSEQNDAYNATKAQFDQDLQAAIVNGHAQLDTAQDNKVNENKAETDSNFEAALDAIVNP